MVSKKTYFLSACVFLVVAIPFESGLCAAGPFTGKPRQPATRPSEKQLDDARRVFNRLFKDVGLTQARKQRIEKLIADLSDDNWKVRENATRELSGVGIEAVSLISKAAESKDIEVALRAQDILKAVRARTECVGVDLNPAIDTLFAAREKELLPMLIKLLNHGKQNVRYAAGYGLRRITGQCFGYNSFDEPQKRAPAIQKWRQWWRKNEATFAFRATGAPTKPAGLLICDSTTKTLTAVTFDGKVAWSRKFEHKLSCAIGLAGGNVVAGFQGVQKSVVEYDRTGKEVWCMNRADLFGGWLVDVHRLPNGNTLTAQSGHGGENAHVTEISRDGKTVWQLKLDQPCGAQRLPNGNTLISEYRKGKVIEVDYNGKVVWEKAGLNRPNDVTRLTNGNTLISEYGGRRVIEVNHGGKIVWQRVCPVSPSSARRLPDGTTVINNEREGAVIVGQDGKVIRQLLKHNGRHGKIRLVPAAVLKRKP